jgi:hypothetical protein
MKNVCLMISGKQGCGKSTLAQEIGRRALKDESLWFYGLKFADPLYEMHTALWQIMEAYGVPRPQKIDGTLMQMLGTEWGRRTISPTVWVDILKKRVDDILSEAKWPRHRLIVIDDARFTNEIDCLKRPDLKIIKLRLEAPEHVRKCRAAKWRPDTTHPSEIGLDDYKEFDKIIFTDTNNEVETAAAAWRIVTEAVK